MIYLLMMKKQTIKELQEEYSQKLQTERRQVLQERYQILTDLYKWVSRHNSYGKNLIVVPPPLPEVQLTRLQIIMRSFLNLLLNRSKKK
jgi:hypothetical protein